MMEFNNYCSLFYRYFCAILLILFLHLEVGGEPQISYQTYFSYLDHTDHEFLCVFKTPKRYPSQLVQLRISSALFDLCHLASMN